MNGNPHVSIIFPVYNECDNLLPLITEISAAMKTTSWSFEIIAVDDGSKDGSRAVLETLSKQFPELRVLFFRSNAGQTAALDAGLRHASGQYIVTLDADRQNDPADIPAMLKKLEEGYDCVLGRRHRRQDGLFLRKIPSKIANHLIRRMWKSEIHDLGCALKVFRREIADELQLYGEMHRFIGLLMEGMGARVVEVDVNHRARVAGVSKYNLNRAYKVVLDLVTLWFLKSYRTKPLHVFGGVGGVLGLSSVGLVLWTLYDKVIGGIAVHRNPLFTIAIFLAVVGLQFLVLGLLAELLIRTYFESGERRPYSISRAIGFPLKSVIAKAA